MELWIRSQDKETLFKANCFIINKIYNNEDINFGIEHYTHYHTDLIGEYKTKKRALEVLDEIQDKMYDNYYSCSVGHNNLVIYEMPKE